MDTLFFIAIVPPEPLANAITQIKSDFAERFESRRALRIMPHITLKAPFKMSENKRKGLLQWFAALQFDVRPFDIALNGFGAFERHGNPVVYVKPEQSEPLYRLQSQVIQKLSNLSPNQVTATDTKFHPHMTVAFRDLEPQNFHKAWADYQAKTFSGHFTASAIHLLEHDGSKWNIIATKNL